jgi:hypothetical protein
MIDQLTAAHIANCSLRHRERSRQTEEEFYSQFGSSRLVHIAAWLTSIDLRWRKHRTPSARAVDCHHDGCKDLAALRPLG